MGVLPRVLAGIVCAPAIRRVSSLSGSSSSSSSERTASIESRLSTEPRRTSEERLRGCFAAVVETCGKENEGGLLKGDGESGDELLLANGTAESLGKSHWIPLISNLERRSAAGAVAGIPTVLLCALRLPGPMLSFIAAAFLFRDREEGLRFGDEGKRARGRTGMRVGEAPRRMADILFEVLACFRGDCISSSSLELGSKSWPPSLELLRGRRTELLWLLGCERLDRLVILCRPWLREVVLIGEFRRLVKLAREDFL